MLTCLVGFAAYLADVAGVPDTVNGSTGGEWRGALESAFQSRLAMLAEDATMPLCVLLPAPDPLSGQRALAISGAPTLQTANMSQNLILCRLQLVASEHSHNH